jgi:hypothetical protein
LASGNEWLARQLDRARPAILCRIPRDFQYCNSPKFGCLALDRKTHGKPVGAEILTGFTLAFNMPLPTAAVTDTANYQLDSVTTKTVKKKVERVLLPMNNFNVS